LGKENARIDDDDLYSLRAIRVKRSMRYWAGEGEKDRRPVDEWWCGGVTLYYNYSAPPPPLNALI
jgi:hypothetical protein